MILCRTSIAMFAICCSGFGIASAQSPGWAHAGLLGKPYAQGQYVRMGVEDPLLAQIDDAWDGFGISLNAPIPWLTSEIAGVDIFADYQMIGLSGTNFSNDKITADIEDVTVGARVVLFPASRFRFFAGAAGTLRDGSLRVGATNDRFKEEGAEGRFGLEADIIGRLSSRAEFRLADGSLQKSRLDGLLIFWPHQHFFIHGGVIVPFVDGLDVGGMIGGGVAY